MYRYYYSRLPAKKKQLCDKIVSQLSQFRQNIEIHDPFIQPKDIFDVFEVIDKDYPEIFYLDIKRKRPIEIAQIGILKRIRVSFAYSQSQIKNYQVQIQKILSALSHQNYQVKTEADWEKVLYGYLTRITSYQFAAPTPADYTIIGPLINHKGICEGYAKTFKFLCDHFNLPSLVVSGTGYNSIRRCSEAHAWNIVCLDGKKYYHVDATWDSMRRLKSCPDLYFNQDDNAMSSDHTWDRTQVPACLFANNSYPFFQTAKELDDYLAEQFRHKVDHVAVQINHVYEGPEQAYKLIEKIVYRHPDGNVQRFRVVYTKERNLIECDFSYY